MCNIWCLNLREYLWYRKIALIILIFLFFFRTSNSTNKWSFATFMQHFETFNYLPNPDHSTDKLKVTMNCINHITKSLMHVLVLTGKQPIQLSSPLQLSKLHITYMWINKQKKLWKHSSYYALCSNISYWWSDYFEDDRHIARQTDHPTFSSPSIC